MKSWKKIKGFENYAVSYVGIVMNLKTKKILKLEKTKGYLRVSLCKEGTVKRFLVHRLVALCYLENKENKTCVNHKNGDKEWNHVSNLEWCSYSENERHSYDILQKINPIRKLTTDQANHVRLIGVKGHNGNIKDLAKKYSVDTSTIYNILKNKYYV